MICALLALRITAINYLINYSNMCAPSGFHDLFTFNFFLIQHVRSHKIFMTAVIVSDRCCTLTLFSPLIHINFIYSRVLSPIKYIVPNAGLEYLNASIFSDSFREVL